jgi:uncharacterized membrane protein YoaK (UPF0700 family)
VSQGALDHPLTRALLVLTFTTGVIDAASFLGLGSTFTANMTGNVVFLGFGIAGSGGLPVVAPIVSLAAFLAGATLGGRIAAGPERSLHLSRAMLIEVGLMLVALAWVLVVEVTPGRFSADVAIALLAFAMGVRMATLRRLHAAEPATTVLTSTLAGLAAGTSLGGGDGSGSERRAGAVVAMLLGAIVGALLLKAALALALLLAAILGLATWIVFVPAVQDAERAEWEAASGSG